MTDRTFAIALAKKAGKEAARAHKTLRASNIHPKRGQSIVTDVDIRLNRMLNEAIHRHDPEAGIISEELGSEHEGRKNVWIVDPIDGTRLYAFDLPLYSVALAKLENGEPILSVVYFPELDRLFVAEAGKRTTLNGKPVRVTPPAPLRESTFTFSPGRGSKDFVKKILPVLNKMKATRHFGCMTVDAMLVLMGKSNGTITVYTDPWDAYPSLFLIQQAGGCALNQRGGPWTRGDDFILLGHPEWVRMLLRNIPNL